MHKFPRQKAETKIKINSTPFCFVLMLIATTLLKVEEASPLKEVGNKRINRVDIADTKISSNVNNARIARYYRSSLILDDHVDGNDNGGEYLNFVETQENEHFDDGCDKTKDLKTESPVTLIEMPESEHPLLRKGKDVEEIKIKSKTESQLNSYSLPDKYEYPELVQSLKAVYREMFITSGLYALNIVSAVGIVLVNKYIYYHYKFPYGLVLTFYHFVLTSIGLQLLAGLKIFPIKPVSLIKVLPLSISFCSYVVLTNLSLQYNSGTFYQILVAPTIALLQFVLYGIKTELSLLPPMLIMFLGVAIATVTELKPSIIGLAIAFSGVLMTMTAIYQILVGTKQKQLGLSAIQLLYYQAPLSSVLLTLAIPFLVDVSKVINFEYSRGLVLAIVSSAFCAFVLNLSMYLVLGRSSALTYNVIGLSKLFLVLSLNYWFFESSIAPNLMNLLGVFLAFSGVCSFSFVKFKLLIKDNNQKMN